MVALVSAVSPFAASVAVAVTVSWKLVSAFAGGVMVSAARVQPVIATEVLPTVAVKLLAPSVSVAPTGIAETVRLKLSEPSVSVRADAIESAIAVPSAPAALATFTAGASATAATVTSMVPTVLAVSPFAASVAVAVTVSWKLVSAFAGGVMVSAARVQPVIATEVLPTVAVKLLAPSVSVAPTGIAETVRLKLSEPSVSVRADAIESAIAASSSPAASAMFSVGASAIGPGSGPGPDAGPTSSVMSMSVRVIFAPRPPSSITPPATARRSARLASSANGLTNKSPT